MAPAQLRNNSILDSVQSITPTGQQSGFAAGFQWQRSACGVAAITGGFSSRFAAVDDDLNTVTIWTLPTI